jgi:hypothetical protein
MAGRKKENFDRGRVEFKASPEWIERVTREGERLGLNLSAFIRMVVTQAVERAETERAGRPKGGK